MRHLSEKTEVKQISLDFPMHHRQRTCVKQQCGQSAFDPRNLLIRIGQCVHVFIGGSDNSVAAAFSFSFITVDLYCINVS